MAKKWHSFDIVRQKLSGLDGLCYTGPVKRIIVATHCRGQREMETFIHEALHALEPDWTEAKVTRTAVLLKDLLWSQGYRKND